MMSPENTIEMVSGSGKKFDRFTSAQILNSIIRSSEASFEVGDDGSWNDLSLIAAIGEVMQVSVNGKPRVTGKVEVLNAPLDARSSSVTRFVVRTVMSDLEYTEIDPSIRVRNVSVKDVIEAAIRSARVRSPVSDKIEIVFRGDVGRDLITGAKTKNGKRATDLVKLDAKQAAPTPGETIKSFLDRHLMRHGLMIWDSPDGRVVVSSPDDEQEPIYRFRVLRGAEGVYNNATMIEKSRDVTGVPTTLTVYGWQGGGDYRRAKVHASRSSQEMIAAGFDRRVGIVDEGVKEKALAERTAARSFAERVRKLDNIVLETDGFAHRSGFIGDLPDYAPDTTADIIAEVQGGAIGIWYTETTMMIMTPSSGCTTQLQFTKQGAWDL